MGWAVPADGRGGAQLAVVPRVRVAVAVHGGRGGGAGVPMAGSGMGAVGGVWKGFVAVPMAQLGFAGPSYDRRGWGDSRCLAGMWL